ncbi:MAG: hypothetical protein PUB54_05295 [Lachnospiraceae bacterium]|nr:hypothetical protein [Lachnospiraceae bacterium]
MKKKMIWIGTIIVIVLVVIIIVLFIRSKTMNYCKFVDRKCDLEIGQYLEYDRGTVGISEEHFCLQFKVKKGCETKIQNALEEKYNDELQELGDEVRLREGSMNNLIKKGTKKHLYSFFQSGKSVKSIEVTILIVDINGQQYAFIYTI